MIIRMLKKKKGFTLTELIVVVTILGVLTAIAVPLVMSYIDDSKTGADNANAKTIEGIVKRVDAKGEDAAGNSFTLSTATGAQIKTAVEAELGTMPAVQQTDFEFYVKSATGETVADDAAPAATGWVVIP